MSIEDRRQAIRQARSLAQDCSMAFEEFFEVTDQSLVLRDNVDPDGAGGKVCIVCGQLPALHKRKTTQPTSSVASNSHALPTQAKGEQCCMGGLCLTCDVL